MLANVSPVFKRLKPLPSSPRYLTLARAAKSPCRVLGVEVATADRSETEKYCHEEKGWRGKKKRERNRQEEKVTLEKCQPRAVNLWVGSRNAIKCERKGDVVTDVCAGLTQG